MLEKRKELKIKKLDFFICFTLYVTIQSLFLVQNANDKVSVINEQ